MNGALVCDSELPKLRDKQNPDPCRLREAVRYCLVSGDLFPVILSAPQGQRIESSTFPRPVVRQAQSAHVEAETRCLRACSKYAPEILRPIGSITVELPSKTRCF
jgi:hypothetical protein